MLPMAVLRPRFVLHHPAEPSVLQDLIVPAEFAILAPAPARRFPVPIPTIITVPVMIFTRLHILGPEPIAAPSWDLTQAFYIPVLIR